MRFTVAYLVLACAIVLGLLLSDRALHRHEQHDREILSLVCRQQNLVKERFRPPLPLTDCNR